ncbi:hypothetical protein AVEN_13732-1, partial [Araneus ventricosus]
MTRMVPRHAILFPYSAPHQNSPPILVDSKPYGRVGGRELWTRHQNSPSILLDSKPYG